MISLRQSSQFSCLAFTLIELSIVLVIIGLVVGGIVAGSDLIQASGIRSQLGQIEQYQAAAASFRFKFSAYPGDIPRVQALSFGFVDRPGDVGRGDGNHRIEAGVDGASSYTLATEVLFFWSDLSKAKLIPGDFSTYSWAGSITGSASVLEAYIPKAILPGNFVQVLSGMPSGAPFPTLVWSGGSHWFQLIGYGSPSGGRNTHVNQLLPFVAYTLDMKADDGNPVTGAVQANSAMPLPTYTYIVDRSAGATRCLVDQGAIKGYNVSYDVASCGIAFKINALPQ